MLKEEMGLVAALLPLLFVGQHTHMTNVWLKSGWLCLGQDQGMSTELLCPHKCLVFLPVFRQPSTGNHSKATAPPAKTLQIPPQQLPHFLEIFIWISEGELEVVLGCTQIWSVFSTISAWRSGNRCWKDGTDFMKGSHALVPASAVASGHHLQELGSLAHEKNLDWVLDEDSAMWGLPGQLLRVFFYAAEGKTCLSWFELPITWSLAAAQSNLL